MNGIRMARKVILNFEKKRGIKNRVRKLIVKEKEITDPKEDLFIYLLLLLLLLLLLILLLLLS